MSNEFVDQRRRKWVMTTNTRWPSGTWRERWWMEMIEQVFLCSSPRSTHERRLNEIKSRLHTLTREKTKYNVDKLNQDFQFLQGEIKDVSRTIQEINETIRTKMRQRRTLVKKHWTADRPNVLASISLQDAERANYKSQSHVHYSNLETALKEEAFVEKWKQTSSSGLTPVVCF